DGASSASPVMVISHSLWQRRFHGDPSIIGTVIHLNTGAITVVGVLPKTFKGTVPGVANDFWVPLSMWTTLADDSDAWRTDRAQRDFAVLGRLRDGVDVATAKANVDVIWRSIVSRYPETNKGATLAVVPELQGRYGSSYEEVRLASMLAQLVAA